VSNTSRIGKALDWLVTSATRAEIVAAAILLLLYFAIPRIDLNNSFHSSIVSPTARIGDEPHYLLMINTLLFRRTVELQNAYDSALHGGLDAGGHQLPDHHTMLVNRITGEHASFFAYEHRFLPAMKSPQPDVYEVSLHPMGYPLLMAFLLWPFHPSGESVEPAISAITVLMCWAAVVLTYLIALDMGMERNYALLAAGVLGLASPWLAYTRSFFSEVSTGFFLTLALWAFRKNRVAGSSLALGIASAFKLSFIVAAAGFLCELWLTKRWRALAEMSLILALCVAAILLFNLWLVPGSALVWTGVRGESVSFAFSKTALFNMLANSRHGLFVFVPWTMFAFAAFLIRWPSNDIRLLAIPVALFLLVLSCIPAVWAGPGACYGPRYFVPFLPWMSLATVETARGTRWMPLVVGLVVISAVIAIPGALRYHYVCDLPMSAAYERRL